MSRGGISKKELRAIKAKASKKQPITFNGLKLLLMNKINPRTGKYYTAEEAGAIANAENRKFIHKFPYNGGK